LASKMRIVNNSKKGSEVHTNGSFLNGFEKKRVEGYKGVLRKQDALHSVHIF
jgi:hypothetical protein